MEAPVSLLATTRLRCLFKDGELNFLLDWVDPVYQHAHPVAQTVGLAPALADDFARVFVKRIVVVRECVEGNQAFDEQVRQLDKESEFGDADDEAVEVFADARLHEL